MNDPQNVLGPVQTLPGCDIAYRVRASSSAGPTRCLVLSHGVRHNEMHLAEFAAAVDPRLLVVLPRGRLTLGPEQHGWFRFKLTPEGPRIVEEEAEQSRLVLIDFLTRLKAHYGIATENLVMSGFSQGSILSASVALTEPELFAGFGLLCGRILPEIEPRIGDRTRIAKLRAFIGHGELDEMLPLFWQERSERWLTDLGVAFESRRYPVDHQISLEMRTDFLQWLAQVLPSGD